MHLTTLTGFSLLFVILTIFQKKRRGCPERKEGGGTLLLRVDVAGRSLMRRDKG